MRLARYFLALLCLLAQPAIADVRLPHVFGDYMVLQRDRALPIWGWAEPGEKVSVSMGDNQATATADAGGRWKVELKAMPAGGPHELVVRGTNTVRFEDVLIGEVWVGSGQSNMAWSVSKSADAKKEIASADFPRIRLLSVPQKLAGEPSEDVAIEWQVCSPETVGAFSAVAYFFGREIHRELKVPVGLINTSWGGTGIEPWTPREGFVGEPRLAEYVETIDAARAQHKRQLATRPATASAPAHPLLRDGRSAPSTMYNAMVHPLVPFAIRGALWYQGENNTVRGDGAIYADKMRALIKGWRGAWGQGDFPFYFVQLAPYRYKDRPDGDPDRLPEIWEAQRAALAVPNTGMVVTTDIATVTNIHPPNKQEVGRRLALWALAGPYGRAQTVASGPLFKSMEVEGGKVRVRFLHAKSGLASRDKQPLTHFEVAGKDGKFVPARAEIDGDTVLVSADAVTSPVIVRFAWDEEANPNLVNGEGLPAAPFRAGR